MIAADYACVRQPDIKTSQLLVGIRAKGLSKANWRVFSTYLVRCGPLASECCWSFERFIPTPG